MDECTGHGSAEDDQRKRYLQEGDCNEGHHCNSRHQRSDNCTPRDLDERLENDRKDCRLEAKQKSRDQRHIAEENIKRRKRNQNGCAGQHEKQSCCKSPPDTVQQPPGIGRELHCFGSWQKHAVVERVQKPGLAQPALFLHEHAVHQGDLARRSSEGQNPDAGERLHGFGKCRPGGRRHGDPGHRIGSTG